MIITTNKLTQTSIGILLVVGLFVLSGCSVVLAARQPSKKNLSVLQNGLNRDRVLAELGQPISSEMVRGEKVEIYQFKQGYEAPTKAARALFHGAADFFTLGIWEAVGTPAELMLHGQEVAVRVTYDNEENVKEVRVLKGKVRGVSSNPQSSPVVSNVSEPPVAQEVTFSEPVRSVPQTAPAQKRQFAPRKNPAMSDVRITPANPILPKKTTQQVPDQNVIKLPVQSENLSQGSSSAPVNAVQQLVSTSEKSTLTPAQNSESNAVPSIPAAAEVVKN